MQSNSILKILNVSVTSNLKGDFCMTQTGEEQTNE